MAHTNSLHYEDSPFALKFDWPNSKKVFSLGECLRSPEYFIHIQERNYVAFERLMGVCPNLNLKTYQVNYIIDRPITRVLFRYALIQNWGKYPYVKLKIFCASNIIPLLQREMPNIMMVKNLKIRHFAQSLISKPFAMVFGRILIEQNVKQLISMLKTSIRFIIRKISCKEYVNASF